VEFKVGQHMWLNIRDFKLLDGLALHFIAKYVGLYEILHKSHPNVYTLMLSIDFVAYPTFHVSNLFLCDEQRLDQKQRM
jgi:hypothetical protein